LQKKTESQMSANLEKRQIGEQFKIPRSGANAGETREPGSSAALLALDGRCACRRIRRRSAHGVLDRTLRSEADVRAALNLMVLATVPFMRESAAAARRRRASQCRDRRRGNMVLAVCATVAWTFLR
jgi:hypothetical protein